MNVKQGESAYLESPYNTMAGLKGKISVNKISCKEDDMIAAGLKIMQSRSVLPLKKLYEM